MGGDSPAAVITSAYAFGARNFDTKSALQFMLKAATQPGTGPHNESERPFLAEELKLGYVPVDKDSTAASRTLEYAADDFAIAQFARARGDSADFAALTKRAGNWQNLLAPETRWIRPRNADGTWLQGFDADRSLPKRPDAPVSSDQDGFEEGNSWQYSFMIPFDYARLIPAMGGNAVVVHRLDSFFSKLICWGEPCFNMANEPDFVVPYTYEYTNQPWKTDDVITRIEQQTFSAKPDGVPGNDDLGATSGVYIWNALGLYPGIPGVGISFGVDRIYDVMEEAQLFPAGVHTGTRVLFFNLGEAEAEAAFDLVQKLRASAIPAELYHEPAKFDKQFKYAEKKGIPFAVIIGSAELGSKTAKLKDLRDGSQKELPFEQITLYLSETINRS